MTAEPGTCDVLTTAEDPGAAPTTVSTSTPDGWRVSRTNIGDCVVVSLYTPRGDLHSRTTRRYWQ